MSDKAMIPDLLRNFALEWEADIRFNKMRDGSEPGPDVKILPREQCSIATTENRIAFMREAADHIEALKALVRKRTDRMDDAESKAMLSEATLYDAKDLLRTCERVFELLVEPGEIAGSTVVAAFAACAAMRSEINGFLLYTAHEEGKTG